jgi:hypothetical protein
MIQTATADGEVPGSADDVWPAIVDLVRRVWHVTDEDIVHATRPERLVHGVVLDGAVSCWLTWELSAAAEGTTTVRVVHDELDAGPAPDLTGVLEMLRSSLPTQREPEAT